jgi:hypothetical protein
MENEIDELTELNRIIAQNDYQAYIKLSIDANGLKKVEITNISELARGFFLKAINFVRISLSIEGDIFIKDPVVFYEKHFKDEIKLLNCIFLEEVTFTRCVFDKYVYFNKCVFKKSLNCSRSEFKSPIYFHNVFFESSVYFRDTKFEDLVDFTNSIFFDNQQFLYTNFLNVAIFSNVNFKKQTQFLYNKVSSNSIISFESTKFNQALDISRANFWCKLNFWGAEIAWESDEMGLYQTDNINSSTSKENDKALMRLRESCRIIKNEFTKENNKIEALVYHKSEMELYAKELNQRFKPNKISILLRKLLKNKFFVKIKNLFAILPKFSEESIVLCFNKYSNHFGTSWVRGLIFTLLVTLLFYILFLLSLSHYLAFDCSGTAINATIKHFVEFLNITNWSIKPFGIENYNWAYIVLFIGRIFIGYGYYQTIQAFRKYGKN